MYLMTDLCKNLTNIIRSCSVRMPKLAAYFDCIADQICQYLSKPPRISKNKLRNIVTYKYCKLQHEGKRSGKVSATKKYRDRLVQAELHYLSIAQPKTRTKSNRYPFKVMAQATSFPTLSINSKIPQCTSPVTLKKTRK
jgi:hypothetical protein